MTHASWPGATSKTLPGPSSILLPSAVTTAILGRHGLNGQLDWAGNPSRPDEFLLNASHLYRLFPAEYGPDTTGSWYTILEWLNTINDEGDYSIDVAPGLLYEAWKWAAEAGVRLPVAERAYPEPDYTIEVGVRYLF